MMRGCLWEEWGESRCSCSTPTWRGLLPLVRLPLDLYPLTSKPVRPATWAQHPPCNTVRATPKRGRGWGSLPPVPSPQSWRSAGGLSVQDAPGFQAPWPGGHVAGLEQAPSLCQQRLGGDQASVQKRGSPHRGAACPPPGPVQPTPFVFARLSCWARS